MTDIFVESWGAGTPVVLVHGSLATGAEEWQAQRPLAEKGYRLLVLDRRGYGRSPMIEGEDFLRDADDIAELMGDGAHLVGHSYGGLGALYAAARRPEETLSLTLLEPGAFALGQRNPAGADTCARGSPDLGRAAAGRAVGAPLLTGRRDRCSCAAPGRRRRSCAPDTSRAARPAYLANRASTCRTRGGQVPETCRIRRTQRGVRGHLRRPCGTDWCRARGHRRRRPRNPVHGTAAERSPGDAVATRRGRRSTGT